MKEAKAIIGRNSAKSLSRGISSDMSSEAVLRRLEIVDELRELAKDLQSAKRLGPIQTLRSVGTTDEPTTQK